MTERLSGRRLILVDDDRDFNLDMHSVLDGQYEVETHVDPDEGYGRIRDTRPDAVLLDIDFGPGREDLGFKILEMIRSLDDPPPVIMLSGLAQLANVVRAVKMGAFHYLTKPPQPGDLFNLINLALADRDLRSRLDMLEGELARRIGDEIIAEDPLSARILEKARRVAPTESTVLITGETGTGKEVIANLLHRLSDRRDRTMVSFNCTSVPRTLIESEMYGAERGAYTGAERTRKGKFELASGSTLFLDEIGDSPLEFQVKLLRAIEHREIERLGGDGPIAVDVRLIAATNKNLEEEVAAGRFRDDLLYRLNVVQLHLPPLRERRLDVLPLARHFLLRQPAAVHRGAMGFTPFAEDAMLSYDWPGNVRELAHTVERAAILGSGPEITISDLFADPQARADAGLPYHDAKARHEIVFKKRYLTGQLEAAGGNVTRAAEASGLKRQAFQRMMRECGLKSDRFRDDSAAT